MWHSENFGVNATNESILVLDSGNLSLIDDGYWSIHYQKRVIDASQWVEEPISDSIISTENQEGKFTPAPSISLLLVALIAATILTPYPSDVKADEWDYWAIKPNADATGKGYDFYTVNNDTGEATLRDTICWVMPNYGGMCETGLSSDSAYVDPTSGDLWFTTPANEIYSYNLETDTWTDRGDEWRGNYTVVQPRSSVSNTSDGSINIGSGSDILLKKTSSGEYHICLLYTSPSPRDVEESRMPSSA